MRRTICALLTTSFVGLLSLSFDTSCGNAPTNQLCRGATVNKKQAPGATEPDDHCTECLEAKCCDLVGDCQGGECANEVGQTHSCVLGAGRRAAVAETDCRSSLRSDTSKSVYQCMRDNCGEACSLPTCRLEPLVPPIGNIQCDRCFAQSCCSLMNRCAENRTCLLALRCIIDECEADFAQELRKSAHPTAILRRDAICGDAGRPPPGVDTTSCFARCIALTFVDDGPEAVAARCLAAQINECGADVDCGEQCAVARDAASD